MKKLFLALAMTLIFASPVYAEQQTPGKFLPGFPQENLAPALPGLVAENEVFVIKVKALCGSAPQIEALLKPSQEIVFGKFVAARASGPIEMPGNPAPGVLMLNPKTTSWTFIENLAPGVYCITAGGPTMTPYGDGIGQKIDYKKPPPPKSNNRYKEAN